MNQSSHYDDELHCSFIDMSHDEYIYKKLEKEQMRNTSMLMSFASSIFPCDSLINQRLSTSVDTILLRSIKKDPPETTAQEYKTKVQSKNSPYSNVYSRSNIENKISTFNQQSNNKNSTKIQKQTKKESEFVHRDTENFDKNLFEDFSCSMEEDEDISTCGSFKDTPLTFLYLRHAESILGSDGQFLTFFDFSQIMKREEEKTIVCDICNKIMKSRFALGGHKGKAHPNSSKAYANRINTKKIREGQREKNKFFKKF
jgi:hypothetical protein